MVSSKSAEDLMMTIAVGAVLAARALNLGQFALKMDLDSAHRIGLSNQNVLMDDFSSDGQSILAPQNGDWSVIPKYIQQQLYR